MYAIVKMKNMKLRKNWLNLRLFLILHYLLDLTKGVNGTTNSTNQKDNSAYFSSQMLTGVLAGVGFFIGLLIFVCVAWQCCCGDACDKKKSATKKKVVMKKRVGPSPPRSEPATRSTTAESRR
ncbi:hypothetical protein CHS0354_016707 [Potamilus streckersoni]|uniref:Uncharacterized protein n=1 Tax=Potamilus streckersoni TaxID=2493646 RepID=A0AAE0TJA0_9BIVA|nr:hypothetical protein CHS0354_016707 [Potamilus streckersoni]